MPYQHIVITGASSGFGAAFARRLAGSCATLHLVARRGDVLHQTAAELRAAHKKLGVSVYACDLAEPAARRELCEKLEALSSGSLLLVNNAGLGDYGEFLGSQPERNNSMMQVNMLAMVELCRALLPRMAEQGGAVINISSLAADLPIPDFAIYAASKAFVSSFSEALRLEMKERDVPVLAVCPGPVHTSFGDVARREGFSGNTTPFKKFFYTEIPTVVNGAVSALERGQARYYPSLKVRLVAALLRNMPLWLLRSTLACRPRRIQRMP